MDALELKHTKRQLLALDADLSGSTFKDVNLAGSAIDDANLSGLRITHCKTDGMTIEGVPVADLMAAYRAVPLK